MKRGRRGRMERSKSPLIIPVEEQVRELNAKLLLACAAAERGFPVILGSRAHLHRRAASLPRGIYLAKSMRSVSIRMFRILRHLGHEIVAWEEEGLVPYPPDYYYRRRMSAAALREAWHAERRTTGKKILRHSLLGSCWRCAQSHARIDGLPARSLYSSHVF